MPSASEVARKAAARMPVVRARALGILARYSDSPTDILDRIPSQTQGTGSGVLDQLGGAAAPAGGDIPAAPEAPASDVPSGQ